MAREERCIGEPSAQYVAKIEDVLDVYARPCDAKRPLACLDEVTKRCTRCRTARCPCKQGNQNARFPRPARQGVCNLFLAVKPLTGKRTERVTERCTALDFAEELRILVEVRYPDAEHIVLITDNFNRHSPACLCARFAPEQARRIAARLEWHDTPEHGSWLDIAECELSVLARQCLRRRISRRA